MKVRANVDYSSKDYDGFRADLIALLTSKIPEYSDFSTSDAGIVLIELLSHGLDVLSYYNDVVANEIFLSTAKDRESVIRLTELIGYTMYNSIAAQYTQIFTITPQATDFVIPVGFKVKTSGVGSIEVQTFETDEEVIIPAGMVGNEYANGAYTYSTTVTHGVSITDDILGSSGGTADQEFVISYTSVIEDSLQIYVDEGLGFQLWTRVNNFVDSLDTSRHYMFLVDEMDKARIRFGDGVSGKIPVVKQNGILADYKVGGGLAGNVATNTITKMVTPLAGVLTTTNPDASALLAGQDKESIASAKKQAPLLLKTLDRAVTRQDFADLAMTLDNVQTALAVEDVTQVIVELYVMVEGSTVLPSGDRTIIEDFFADRIIIGTDLNVNAVTWYPIDLTVTVKAYPSYANAEVKTAIDLAIAAFFAQGEFDFDEPYVRSAVVDLIMGVPGVRSVNIDLDDTEPGATSVIQLDTATVTVTEGR